MNNHYRISIGKCDVSCRWCHKRTCWDVYYDLICSLGEERIHTYSPMYHSYGRYHPQIITKGISRDEILTIIALIAIKGHRAKTYVREVNY